MARPKKKTTSVSHLLAPEEPKTEWQKALAHLEENIKLYVAGIVFIIICLAIGALIRVNAVVKEKDIMTRYAEAALEEDPQARLQKYEAIKGHSGQWNPEVLYMMAETAIEAGELDTAKQLFEELLAGHGNSAFVPQAKEGLAFLAWSDARLEEALKGYEELTTQWPAEFVARRAHYTMGQILEELGRPEEAIAAYRKQASVFPESAVAAKAEQALTRLSEKHPDLFADAGEGATGSSTEAGDILADADLAQTPYLSVDTQDTPEIE